MTRDATLSDKQKELLREVWVETVSRVRNLYDIDAIAQEWLALMNELRTYEVEAHKRYVLHAPEDGKYTMLECRQDDASHLRMSASTTGETFNQTR